MKKKIIFSAILVVGALSIVSADSREGLSQSKKLDKSNKEDERKLILLGVDGLSLQYYLYAKNTLGLFKEFKSLSAHIAPFPSISDYSWNLLVKSQEVFGKRARIKNYEAAYFDRDKNRLVEDSREYFRRLGHDHHYFNGAFQNYFNPYLETLMYLPTQKLPLYELDILKDSIKEQVLKNSLITSMIASVDAIAHTQDDLITVLKKLDSVINEISSFLTKNKIKAEIILVSDHGQGMRFSPGEKIIKLKVADVKKSISDAGFHITKSLVANNDVSIPIMALGNYASLYLKDTRRIVELLNKLKTNRWFEHGIFVKSRTSSKVKIEIHDKNGFAILESKGSVVSKKNSIFKYTPITSNSLNIDKKYHGQNLSKLQVKKATEDTAYPDSLYRIALSAMEYESDMPDLLITMKEAYRIKGDLDKYTTMYRTHGSLSRNSTLGVVASTYAKPYSKYIRTEDVLDMIDLAPIELFKRENHPLIHNLEKSLVEIESPEYKGIPTGNKNYSSNRVFGVLNKVVENSQYVLDSTSMTDLLDLFAPSNTKNMLSNSSINFTNIDYDNIKKVELVSAKDLGVLTDLILEFGNIELIESDPRFKKIVKKLKSGHREIQEYLKLNSDVHDLETTIEHSEPYTYAAKTILMKGYATKFLLEKAMNIPEFSFVEDLRSPEFRRRWLEMKSDNQKEEYFAISEERMVKKLFSEIFKERKLKNELAPQKFPLLYSNIYQGNTTLVYIPGIYNSIFNNEIFEQGLDSLRNNFGVRVISPPVFSACSSDFNGNIINKFLKSDIENRLKLGLSDQKYFIFGYSKGAVDTLHAFIMDKDLARNKITGLFSIASPIKGSSILSKTDLPITALRLLGNETIPEVCMNEEKAAKSITPDGAHRFLKDNIRNLVGLTRYYSLSFSSNMKDAHLWMKATKNIAQFSDKNDGVVTVSASQFPEELKATNLGVVKGDHLSGIVASHFPQKSFMEAIFLTLSELDAFSYNRNQKINQNIIFNSLYTKPSEHRISIKEKLGISKMNIDDLKNNEELLKLKKLVIKKLMNTEYEMKDFDISRNQDGVLRISYTGGMSDPRFLWFFNSTVTSNPIESLDDFIDYLMKKRLLNGRDLTEVSEEVWRTYPVSDRVRVKLPDNDLNFWIDDRINIRKLNARFKGKKVAPITPSKYEGGFDIIFDHRRARDFRSEYQFNYESTAPMAPDNDAVSGWKTILTQDGELMGKMSSKKSSIRLTSYAMRFRPQDFKNIEFNFQVNNDVDGADPLLNGTGKDDSAFQVWFTIRELKKGQNREVFNKDDEIRIFGYYFGDKNQNIKLVDGEIYENSYSKRNFIVAVLPEAKQLLLGHGKQRLGKRIISKQNFYGDLKIAFPDMDTSNIEVIAITFQHDSNDTGNDSEALFKSINFSNNQ